jgi:hypothetical protein
MRVVALPISDCRLPIESEPLRSINPLGMRSIKNQKSAIDNV